MHQGNADTSDKITLDFSQIAGRWTGEAATERQKPFWIEAMLSPSAEQDTAVGTIRYGWVGEQKTVCAGSWLAVSADDPVYIISEQIADPCPNGTVRLERNPRDGSLAFEFTPADGDPSHLAATTLTPGE